MRILIIDDDKDLCMLTQKVLSKNGYMVDAFFDPKQAIKHAQEKKPSLILMDVMLPGLSGPEIVNSLKNDPRFKDVPVVFLTALITGEDRSLEDQGLTVGGVQYPTLGKPYEIDKLLAMVGRFIKKDGNS
jgi:DNA-binding response OmpR family regulator